MTDETLSPHQRAVAILNQFASVVRDRERLSLKIEGHIKAAVAEAERRGREHARNPCDKIFSHKWLDAECVENGCQSLLLERRGRIAMREEAARFVDTHFEGDDPVTRKPKIFEWQIGAHPTLMGDTIRSLPADPPLTTPPEDDGAIASAIDAGPTPELRRVYKAFVDNERQRAEITTPPGQTSPAPNLAPRTR